MATPSEFPIPTEALVSQTALFRAERRDRELEHPGSGMAWCLDHGIGRLRMELGVIPVSGLADPDAEPVEDRARRWWEECCASCEITTCRLHDIKGMKLTPLP